MQQKIILERLLRKCSISDWHEKFTKIKSKHVSFIQRLCPIVQVSNTSKFCRPFRYFQFGVNRALYIHTFIFCSKSTMHRIGTSSTKYLHDWTQSLYKRHMFWFNFCELFVSVRYTTFVVNLMNTTVLVNSLLHPTWFLCQ
jgi:hypothetical protein